MRYEKLNSRSKIIPQILENKYTRAVKKGHLVTHEKRVSISEVKKRVNSRAIAKFYLQNDVLFLLPKVGGYWYELTSPEVLKG